MKFYWEINPEDLLKNGNYEKIIYQNVHII